VTETATQAGTVIPAADRPLRVRAVMGAQVGLSLGIVTSVLSVGLIVVGGLSAFHARYGTMPVWSLVLCYLALGFIGGVLWGVMLPLTRARLGTAFVGAVVGVVACLGFGISVDGVSFWLRWGALQFLEVALFGVTGVITAFVMQRRMAQIRLRRRADISPGARHGGGSSGA
jgi:hypothetical protein